MCARSVDGISAQWRDLTLVQREARHGSTAWTWPRRLTTFHRWPSSPPKLAFAVRGGEAPASPMSRRC